VLKLAADQAARHSGRSPEWQWKFRLLQAETLMALARRGDAEALLGDKPLPGLDQLEARRLIDLASIRQGRKKEATELLTRAGALVRDPELAIRVHLVQGLIFQNAGELDAADRELQAGLDGAVRAGRREWEALALNNLCYLRKTQNRPEEAVAFGLRAVAAAEAAGALRTAGLAGNNLGSAYSYLGDFPAAFKHLQKAIDRLREMKAANSVMIGLGELGLAYDRSGQWEKAIPPYREAYDLAVKLKSPRDVVRHAENLALVYIKLKQWDAASEWNQNAIKGGPPGDNLAYLTRNRARIALGRGDSAAAAATARELLQIKTAPAHIHSAAWATLGLIDTDAKRYAQANANFERGLALIEATRSDLSGAQNRVTLLSRLIGFYQDYVDAAATQNDDLRALRVAESSRARVLAERLGRDYQTARLLDDAGLRSFTRSANVRVLAFWVAPNRSFAWLIGPQGVKRFELPSYREIDVIVSAHREVVEHSIFDPLTEARARVLWDKALAPIAAAIPQGSRVIVIPDGPLHRVNLETVVAPTPTPHYWLEDVELAVAPSISIAMSKVGESVGGGSVLAIGAPDYNGTGFQPLPGAAPEIDGLRKRFAQAAVITGAQATPRAYRAAGPEKYSTIHFAAHAMADEERPLESAVVLSRDGDSFKLLAREVIDIPIRADLVTLSACRSAGVRAYAGEGLIGFAWAFLHAGAKAVVAGLWPVSDESSGPLMARFYDGVAAKRGASCALREGKLAILREGRFGKAFYWGAFQTYLGGTHY
jgi:CHAT domain-containing protein